MAREATGSEGGAPVMVHDTWLSTLTRAIASRDAEAVAICIHERDAAIEKAARLACAIELEATYKANVDNVEHAMSIVGLITQWRVL
jgi:hypothetical protein